MEQMINNARRLRSALNSFLREAASGSMLPVSLAMGPIAALLALYAPDSGIAPFGLGCAAGVWYAGISPYFACLGAFAGYLAGGSYAFALSVPLLCGVIALTEHFFLMKRVYRLLAAFGAEAAVLLLSAAFRGEPLFYAIGASCVSTLCAVIWGHGVCAAEQLTAARRVSDSELLTMAASAGLVTLCMGNFSVLGSSPAMIFAGVCTLLAARRCGIACTAFAVTLGAGRVLATGGDLHFIAVIAASALAAAALAGIGKAGAVLGFAAINALFLGFIRGTGLFSAFETGLACAIYLLLPSRLYMPSADESRPAATDGRYGRLQYRIGELAEVLKELSRVFGGSEGGMLQSISDTLRNCVSAGSGNGRENYRVSAASAGRKKPGSSRSGDCFTLAKPEAGILLCISDGMGSGDAAYRESRETIDLLSDLLTVGFDMRAAGECINRLFMRRARDDMYATLDALLLDPSTGNAAILKLGAPPSYVLRGGKLYTLYAENLPAGISDGAEQAIRRVALESGDIVIMMSDGLADALGSGLFAAIIDCIDGEGDLGLAAEAIADRAVSRGTDDDMTVLLARVERTNGK